MSLSYKSQAAIGPRIIPINVYTALDKWHWVGPNSVDRWMDVIMQLGSPISRASYRLILIISLTS